ncbi:MAG: LysM peptidoglycan-binding domain-containing protein [Nitrospirota bacterium]
MLHKKHIKTILIALISGFIFFISNAHANIVYTVKKGDSLYEIAKRHNISVKEIQNINKVSAKKLKPGSRITLPVDGSAAGISFDDRHDIETKSLKKASPVPADKNVKSSKPEIDDIFHTVKKGETLTSVAKKYSTTPAELKGLNNLKSSKLKKGQKLLVKRSVPATYTVRKGDNIWVIARKFGIDPDDLMVINELDSPSLKIGQKLLLQEIEQNDPDDINGQHLTKNIEEELDKISHAEDFSEKSPSENLIAFARKLMNIPYKFGGNSFLGIDCSAYVKKVYGFLGIDLPRTAREQFNTGESVEKEDLSIGDLVFFRTYASFPSHVGIYLGNNLFIHASSRNKKVRVDSLDTPYYLKRFIGGKRLLSSEEKSEKPSG